MGQEGTEPGEEELLDGRIGLGGGWGAKRGWKVKIVRKIMSENIMVRGLWEAVQVSRLRQIHG